MRCRDCGLLELALVEQARMDYRLVLADTTMGRSHKVTVQAAITEHGKMAHGRSAATIHNIHGMAGIPHGTLADDEDPACDGRPSVRSNWSLCVCVMAAALLSLRATSYN